VQIGGEVVAPEIIGEGISEFAQCREFCASFLNDLVGFVPGCFAALVCHRILLFKIILLWWLAPSEAIP
jgi:hypothetical protein